MYLDECRKRRADRVDRARNHVVLDPWAESVYQQFNDWLHSAAGDRTLTNLSRPPPLTIANEGILAPHPVHIGGYGNPEPGTVRFQNPSIMAAPISVSYWDLIRTQTLRGDSGYGRPLDRNRSWGYLQ